MMRTKKDRKTVAVEVDVDTPVEVSDFIKLHRSVVHLQNIP